MTLPIIETYQLGKRYKIRRYDKLDKGGLFGGLVETKLNFKGAEETWALRNVNLKVDRGSTVGVLGANGSGKSTLLKLFSEVTDPSEGSITLRGNISSILEVGIGFHNELTGKENIYLSGALLGMNKAEIDEKFDSLVEFSGVERYLNEPVKRYSSGMFVRLAFAVASHLKTEILLVDEVLAVGDKAFTGKALAKMHQLRDGGTTLMIVSHDLQLLEEFCTNAMYFDKGQLMASGDPKEIIALYQNQYSNKDESVR